jgi:hypothetical protein
VIRLLLRTAVFLGSAAIGLLVAAWLVPGVSVSVSGFITAVVIFSVAQAILSPFFLKMASRYASAFLGGIGLVSTQPSRRAFWAANSASVRTPLSRN